MFADELDFVHDVMPILKTHCGQCHTGEKKEGGLAMNTRAQLLAGGENGKSIISGDSTRSHLLVRLTSDDPFTRMPPEGSRVPPEKVAILKKWIDAGLPWEQGITLGTAGWEPPLKPRIITLPPPVNGRRHPIDRLLDAGLAKEKQPTPPPVSDAAFLRRVSLDAIGLLPLPTELQAFLEDRSDDKRETMIDKLLANDVGYADHWLTTWNDLLRNDYTGTGFITKGRNQITTWLYESLRDNKPYDLFVRELISPTPESAGFIDGIQWRGEVNSSQTREIQFAQNVSQVFLGINMKCASCHDSFIDRWTLSEAYNLAAIYADQPLELNRCDKPTGKMATPKWMFPEIGDIDPRAPKAERLKQLAALMTHPDNGRFTRTLVNRVWHRLMGRGIVHPVDAMHTQPWNEDLLDYLAVRFTDDGYDLRQFIRFVMTSQAYQSRTVILKAEPAGDYVYAGPIAKRMTAEQFLDTIWQITGTHPDKPTAQVDRSERKPKSAKDAEQDTAPFKPVPVVAKWIWHDGKGSMKSELRKTISLKTVPKTAVVLATCDNAFTMKVNGTVVASSKDWQIPVRFNIASRLIKGENKIEVAGEMFGGSAGFICQLVLLENGTQRVVTTDKSWEVRKPDGAWQAALEVHAYGNGPWGRVLDGKAVTPDALGRAGPPVRAALMQNDFLMRSLGRPHRDQVVTTRPSELTTLQAIDLANDEILTQYLTGGAGHIVGQGKSSGELIDWLYLYALSRPPTAGERAVLTEVVADGNNSMAIEDLLWMVFMQPEFQIVR
ncbi:MAG: DUF1549 domain-containing protein [Planctomycetota bacterium]|nr:DUF1549 domain-containing protein [Planctomycetota bacterium]